MFILPVIVFILFLVSYFDKKKRVVESIAVSWLFITLYTWVVMEVSSAFGILGTPAAMVSWILLCVVLVVYIVKNNIIKRTAEYCKTEKQIRDKWKEHRTNLVCLFLFCCIICLFSVLRGQNLIDNLYHRLPKIMHWIQNGRVGYFATVTPAEIQYTKLTEYMIAQVYLLKGPDRMINLVQAGAYVCSGGCLYGVSRKIGTSRRFAILAVWICLLTPMVIIETFTTQTDVVAGTYLLIFIYFLLDYIQADKLSMSKAGILSAVCLSASVLFGYLAKPTVCFAMVIFFMWMCLVRILRRDKIKVLLQYILIGMVTAVVLFLPDVLRTYQYNCMPGLLYAEAMVDTDKAEVGKADSGASGKDNKNADDTAVSVDMENSAELAMGTAGMERIVASVADGAASDNESAVSVESEEIEDGAEVPEENETVNNETETLEDQRVDNDTEAGRVVSNILNPKEFIIVAIRNLAANATSRCFPKINKLLVRFVEKCESVLNYTGGYRYFRVMLGEDIGETSEPSPAIMYFLLAAWICVIVRFSKIGREQFLYLLFATMSLVVQAGLMGYTWYRQRYLIGVMAVLCPAFAVVLENIKVSVRTRMDLAVAMMAVCSLGTANALSYEIPYTVFGFQGAKLHQYFIHDSDTELYYQLMLDYINEKEYKNVGMMGVVSYEYALWQGIENLERLEHVGVNPVYFEAAKLEDMSFMPECIIEEIPAEFVLDEYLYIHDKPYMCDWKATDENGRNYAILIPRAVYEEQNAIYQTG